MNFSWAMDLDPKGANNQIKEAIDKRYVTDEDDPTAGTYRQQREPEVLGNRFTVPRKIILKMIIEGFGFSSMII